ncbi:MAG: 23S rRNA (adenine(2503)-C(2))-methyltransferase RlmN [Dehalococcoidia bacterium]|nr:23S rRNA (adenine(2503)-C(2))-methyltransferase RlmN [Dehalococcoidia bacterium]
MPAREHILDRSPEALRALLEGWGEPGYRADQLSRAVFAHGATEFASIPGLPAALRARLEERFRIAPPEVLARVTSEDGATTKVLLDLGGGAAVEAVRMAYDPEDASSAGRARVTLCVSTQVGCAMGCTFCATGQQGFTRNLTTSEILAQVLHFVREADGDPSRRVTNVVFMGMGEPLANYAHTLEAVRWLVDERGLHLRQRGITISTVGLRSGIRRLVAEGLQVNLTISLHAPDDELRRELIPAAAGTTIDELVESAREYIAATGRRVTFAYALLDGVNDGEEQARRLASRVRGLQAHVNLIPYNPTAGEGLRRPTRERVRAFLRTLQSLGVNATVRIERGAAIAAACGQLRTDVERERASANAPRTSPRGEGFPEASARGFA